MPSKHLIYTHHWFFLGFLPTNLKLLGQKVGGTTKNGTLSWCKFKSWTNTTSVLFAPNNMNYGHPRSKLADILIKFERKYGIPTFLLITIWYACNFFSKYFYRVIFKYIIKLWFTWMENDSFEKMSHACSVHFILARVGTS